MRISRFHRLLIIFVFLILSLVIFEVPKSEAASPSSQDKALSFLGDVIGLDMSKYTATLTRSASSGDDEEVSYNLGNSLTNHVDASFMFFSGKLGRCSFGQFSGQLLYSQPEMDQYNQTLRLIQNYQQWLDDPQVAEMANLLSRVGSIHNATEFSGNITMKIAFYTPNSIFIKFSNTINDVDYTGLRITYGSYGSFYFDDSRTYQTIGDTNISISKEQAITIAEDYVRFNFSYNRDTVHDLNVTGVGTVQLTSRINPGDDYVNGTLSPYWYIFVNVNSVPSDGVRGVIVHVSANDGTVIAPELFGDPLSIGQFFPINFSLLFVEVCSVLAIVAGLVLIITGIVLHRRKNRALIKKPPPASKLSTVEKPMSLSLRRS
jgi:hypothetical protein